MVASAYIRTWSAWAEKVEAGFSRKARSNFEFPDQLICI